MQRNNAAFLQNSFKPNSVIFSPISDGKHLIPSAPLVDMGMSNAFTGSSRLVPSEHLTDLSPLGSNFMPMKSPDELLKSCTSQVKSASPADSLGQSSTQQSQLISPPGGAQTASSPYGIYGNGVVDPNYLKSFNPPPPPLSSPPPPLANASQAASSNAQPGQTQTLSGQVPVSTVYIENGTYKPSGGNMLPAEPFRNPDSVSVNAGAELSAPGLPKLKYTVSNEGVDAETSKGREKIGVDGSAVVHQDWNGNITTGTKVGGSVDIPTSIPGTFVTAGASKAWMSDGKVLTTVEGGGAQGIIIPLKGTGTEIKAKGSLTIGFTWEGENIASDGKSVIYDNKIPSNYMVPYNH